MPTTSPTLKGADIASKLPPIPGVTAAALSRATNTFDSVTHAQYPEFRGSVVLVQGRARISTEKGIVAAPLGILDLRTSKSQTEHYATIERMLPLLADDPKTVFSTVWSRPVDSADPECIHKVTINGKEQPLQDAVRLMDPSNLLKNRKISTISPSVRYQDSDPHQIVTALQDPKIHAFASFPDTKLVSLSDGHVGLWTSKGTVAVEQLKALRYSQSIDNPQSVEI
jgi:hypothetical protein